MKIFLVCNSLGEGGAERVHVNLANGFVQRGHEVWLVVDLTKKATYPVDERVRLLQLFPPKNNKILKWGGAIFKLRKYLRKYKPDVVIGNMRACSLLSMFSAIGLNVPVVMTIHHALESMTYKLSRIDYILDRFTPCLYAATTLLTEPDRELMFHKYHNTKKIYVIPNPLSFAPLKDRIVSKENFVLAAGRIDQWQCKGWDILIRAWGKVCQSLELKENTNQTITDRAKKEERQVEWRLKIAGNGSQNTFDMLRNMARENGVEGKIDFLGYQSDMLSLYQKAAIFCLSSRSEGLPMVLIEAMSQGCAPVATDFKGRTQSIITNESQGFLCKPEDVEDLALKLIKMICDDVMRKEIQQCALKRASFYETKNIIMMWEQLFKEIS